MLSFITTSHVVTGIGAVVTVDGDGLTFGGEPVFIVDGSVGELAALVAAAPVNFVTRKNGSIMAINARFPQAWHTGETATAFAITVRHYDGTARDDIASATFTLVNRANNAKLIDSQACQTVANGILSYRPSAPEMATACLFLAQFTATLDTGYVLPTIYIEGEIEASL